MEFLFLVVIIVLIASMGDTTSSSAKRTHRLDPGDKSDFGGGIK